MQIEGMQIEERLMKVATSLETLLAMCAADEHGTAPPSAWAQTAAVNNLSLVLADLEAEHERNLATLRTVAGGA